MKMTTSLRHARKHVTFGSARSFDPKGSKAGGFLWVVGLALLFVLLFVLKGFALDVYYKITGIFEPSEAQTIKIAENIEKGLVSHLESENSRLREVSTVLAHTKKDFVVSEVLRTIPQTPFDDIVIKNNPESGLKVGDLVYAYKGRVLLGKIRGTDSRVATVQLFSTPELKNQVTLIHLEQLAQNQSLSQELLQDSSVTISSSTSSTSSSREYSSTSLGDASARNTSQSTTTTGGAKEIIPGLGELLKATTQDRHVVELEGRGAGTMSLTLPQDIRVAKGDVVTMTGVSGALIGMVDTVVSTPGTALVHVYVRYPLLLNQLDFVYVEKNTL
jgi:hypothetical protein